MSCYPLTRAERRLQERVAALLPGERVLAAVVAFKGPPPGVEGCLVALVPFGALISAIGALGVEGQRRHVTLAVTDQGVVRLKTSGLGAPIEVISRHGLDAFGQVNETGDFWLEFAGERYYFNGMWSGQLWRIRRMQ